MEGQESNPSIYSFTGLLFFTFLLALQLQTVRYILQHGAQDVISYAPIKTTGAAALKQRHTSALPAKQPLVTQMCARNHSTSVRFNIKATFLRCGAAAIIGNV